MTIRNNVRERRRERIAQIIGRQAVEMNENGAPPANVGSKELRRPQLRAEEEPAIPGGAREGTASRPSSSEKDPEQWWKERERQLKSGTAAGWQGVKGIAPAAPPAGNRYTSGEGPGRAVVRGFMARLAVAAVLFAGFWGWLQLELPGSPQARDWMTSTVSQDMNFQAVEAWYDRMFGGSPAILSFNRGEPDTRQASALLDPAATSPPVEGKLVQSFADNGTGVKFAARGGEPVKAIYTGRVQQVTQDQDGGATVIVMHQDRIVTVYGGLGQAAVKANDWVETGQKLGDLANAEDGAASVGVLYFAVQRDGEAIDPAEVIAFD